jgi:hypothetical protein
MAGQGGVGYLRRPPVQGWVGKTQKLFRLINLPGFAKIRKLDGLVLSTGDVREGREGGSDI